MLQKLFQLEKKRYGQYNDMEILPYLLQHEKVSFVMFGVDNLAIWCLDWIKSMYQIEPDYIISDIDERTCLNGIDVIPLKEWEVKDNDLFFVVVADKRYAERDFKEKLIDVLKAHNAVTIFNAHRVAKPYWVDWYAYIKENIERFEKSYNLFEDEVSRKTFWEYLKVYITGDRYGGFTYPESYKYWGRESEDLFLFKQKEDEVILNLGGSCGDTIFQYLKNDLPFKKIICVEAEPDQVAYINRSIKLLDQQIREKISVDNVFIESGEAGIDTLYGCEPISLIEMDIEGGEISALTSGIDVIKRNRPVMAICVYHKVDDLIKIPEFINSHFENYTYVLRKYPSCYYETLQNLQQVNELVLYAIPKERRNIND